MESVSKQGRKNFKYVPTMHKDPAFDDLDEVMDYMETKDAHDEGTVKDSEKTRVSTEDQVSTDKPKFSTDKPNKGTAKPKDGNSDESAALTTVFKYDETIAQFLTKKVLEEKAESDVESEAEEEKKKLAEEEATKAAFTNKYDFIQARLNADKILLEKLQEEEREKFTIEQRAKFLYDTITAQRRFLAQQRYEAIRNKFPTRNQLRNQMMTYLKFVGGYKHAQLNKKKFEEIQVMYEKVKRANENFIPIGSAKDKKLIERMNEKAVGMDKEEVSEEPESTKMKAPKRSKRQKTNSDYEEENQLRTFLKIVPKEEEKIDYEVLDT
ncbi:hypothetical protein Tco_1431755, partial [Tanacetum coccineum]